MSLIFSGPRGFRQKKLQNLDSMQLRGQFTAIWNRHINGFIRSSFFIFFDSKVISSTNLEQAAM
jgi:hypothetical protein